QPSSTSQSRRTRERHPAPIGFGGGAAREPNSPRSAKLSQMGDRERDEIAALCAVTERRGVYAPDHDQTEAVLRADSSIAALRELDRAGIAGPLQIRGVKVVGSLLRTSRNLNLVGLRGHYVHAGGARVDGQLVLRGAQLRGSLVSSVARRLDRGPRGSV